MVLVRQYATQFAFVAMYSLPLAAAFIEHHQERLDTADMARCQ
jgi:hypothetical protein